MDAVSKESSSSTSSEASIWTWLGLSFVAMASFWFQAVITEERFVPALNMISIAYNIPEDVAGATLMAAGASSPELMSSMISLFVTHSNLGLGTIVGSEIFNQLMICAGAIWASPPGHLKLDPMTLTREVGFYALSILLLDLALGSNHSIIVDTDQNVDDDLTEKDRYLEITFTGSLLLCGAYILYVGVCIKQNDVIRLVKKYSSIGTSVEKDVTMDQVSRDIELDSSFYHNHVNLSDIYDSTFFVHEPTLDMEGLEMTQPSLSSRSYLARSLLVAVSAAEKQLPALSGLPSLEKVLSREKPSDLHGLFDLHVDKATGSVSFFMWQRSIFYNQSHCARHTWELRWFSINDGELKSIPDRTQAECHAIVYPAFSSMEVDMHRMILKLHHMTDQKADTILLAPSYTILHCFLSKSKEILEKRKDEYGNKESDFVPPSFSPTRTPYESILAFPVTGSNFAILAFCVTYPLRLLIHWTIPDVRIHDLEGNAISNGMGGKLSNSFIAAMSCLFWIVVGSYAMCVSLEDLARRLHIPDTVVGTTVSAVGTSLPSYVASKVAAEKGFGNMAVANAFGSNTFNILVGLGLPWLLYTTFTGFRPYDEIRDDGIGESVAIMALVLLLFIVTILLSGFVLYKWHALLFLATYCGYLLYVIGSAL